MVTRVSTPGPKLESLLCIDMSTLSQSELHALSLCSNAAFDVRRSDDVVIPKINRTLFNESADPRRQTLSLFRLAPRTPNSFVVSGHRSRLPGLLPHARPSPGPANCDHERAEDKLVVNFLKRLLNGKDIQDSQLETGIADKQIGPNSKEKGIVLSEGKRKRMRKEKEKLNVVQDCGEVQLDILNKNGAAVDLAALKNADGLYAAELRRRTHGLEREEELLGFLRSLQGQWGSRRKRRRVVSACEFSDALPVGWKLLLGLRRKEGRISIYCRRYIR